MYACGFSVPQMRQRCLFTYPPWSKWVSSEKMICKSIAVPLSAAKTYWMVNWFQLLNQWNFVWRSLWSLCKIRLNDVFEMFSCWKRRWLDVDGASHTLSATAAIFLGVRTPCFWLFTLWFIDEDASFFHFFHKIMNIRSWRCFFSSKIRKQFSHTLCNITMIFKVMSQYFPALFKRIQQPYSFGGRLKLIICQIRHEVSVTVHEIRTSWKKR